MAQYGLFGPIGGSKTGARGIFGPVGQKQKSVYDQTTQAEADAIAQDALLQQQKQQAAAQPKGQSLFNKIKGVAVRVGKDVGEGAGRAARAVARPVIDVASGQGGKAAHDAAQLSSDVTGGTANYLANVDIVNPIKELAASGNKKAEVAATRKSNEDLGLGKNGKDLRGGLLKFAGNATTAALIPVGGGEAAGLKDAVAGGAKVLAKKAAKDAAIGTTAGTANTVAQNPNASVKQIAENAALSTVLGGTTPVAAKIFRVGASRVLGALKANADEGASKAAMHDVMTPEQADRAAAAAHTQITPEDQSAGAEEVGVKTPLRPGIKQQSTTYRVGVRAPQAMSDAEYTKKFNSLSTAYEKEMSTLKDKPPLTQQAGAEAIDKKYQALISELNDNYKRGVLPEKTTVTRVSSTTDKAGKTTGGAPKSGVNVRSEAYNIGKNSRVTPKEAAAKLKQAGYAPDEAKAILSDALPEKGLSMPGSPKKIGLNDASVQQSAKNFDEANGDITNTVREQTLKNDGITIDTKGNVPEKGYAYAPNKDTELAIPTKEFHENPKLLEDYITKHKAELDKPGYHLGTWSNPEDGKTYLDISKVGEPSAKTIAEAHRAKQLAVYDLEHGNTVEVGKIDENGVYSAHDTPANIHDQYQREVSAASSSGGDSGTQKISQTAQESSSLRPLQSIEESPEQGTSKLGQSVREKALQAKIISKTEAEAEDLPAYNKANMKQQAEYATQLIKENPQHAIDIALGKAEPPAHVLPQMVYNAVEEYARGLGGDDGAKLLLDLSRSKQVSNLTTMAQNVRAAAERDPHSPTNLINEVKVAREQAAKRRGRTVGKLAQKDASAIRKVTPKITKDDWTAFVDGLRC